jgi:hypothetical protein
LSSFLFLVATVTKTVPGGTFFVSSFFIGLSFCSGLFAGNVAPPIQDFLSRVNIWDSKKNFMEICVKVGSGSSSECVHLFIVLFVDVSIRIEVMYRVVLSRLIDGVLISF